MAVQSCVQSSRQATASEAKGSILNSPGMQGLQLQEVGLKDGSFSVSGERTHMPAPPPYLSYVPKMAQGQGAISWRQHLNRRNDGRCSED